LIFIPSTTMTTFTGPVISAPSFGSAKNTLPLGVSFFPHPMTNESIAIQTTDKFIRYTMRIWAIPVFLKSFATYPRSTNSHITRRVLASLEDALCLTTCYERTPITCKRLVKQQSFHAQTK